MCKQNNNYGFVYNIHNQDFIPQIKNHSLHSILNINSELIEWLESLFGLPYEQIPNLSPILLNYLEDKLSEQNRINNITTKANISNFAVAKTNVFLQGIKAIILANADDKNSLLQNYANLVLSVQQSVEEQHVAHTTEIIQTIQDTGNNDLLLYVSERDSKVRLNHRKADGTVLPKSNTWWNEAFKLLGEYNCRCTVINAPKGSKMRLAPSLVIKDAPAPTDIHLQDGKAILFRESLPVFQNADPIIRRQFKQVGF